jgi:hypothetical protein
MAAEALLRNNELDGFKKETALAPFVVLPGLWLKVPKNTSTSVGTVGVLTELRNINCPNASLIRL